MSIAGLKLMVPSSVGGSGVSVSSSGKVSFTSAATININGCFTSSYINYLIVSAYVHSSTSTTLQFRMRASGSDASSGYDKQLIRVSGASASGVRETSQNSGNVTLVNNTAHAGSHLLVYGPQLAQATVVRSLAAYPTAIEEWASVHTTTTSYDGITLFVPSGNLTGSCTVYGLAQ